MLYTCGGCGEAWDAAYISQHPNDFKKSSSGDYVSCPCCMPESLPGVPGITTHEHLAVSRVIRVTDTSYVVLHGLTREAQTCRTLRGAIAEALCRAE